MSAYEEQYITVSDDNAMKRFTKFCSRLILRITASHTFC